MLVTSLAEWVSAPQLPIVCRAPAPTTNTTVRPIATTKVENARTMTFPSTDSGGRFSDPAARLSRFRNSRLPFSTAFGSRRSVEAAEEAGSLALGVRRHLRRRLLIGGGVAAVLLVAGGAYLAYRMHQARNIVGSPSVQFTTTAVPKKKVTANPQGVVWPMWGYDGQRLRSPVGISLRPPFRTIWTFHGRALLEFPPAVAYGKLYLTTFWGHFFALDEKTGKPVWKFNSGRCGWSSPAVSDHVVYQTFIGHPNCNQSVPGTDGEVVALNARNGKVIWRYTEGPDESSPLVAHGLVYVGNWNGDELAIDAKTGKLRWSFATGGKIKGSAAISGPNIVVGSYDGHVYALNALTGKQVWRASAQPRLAGALGTFYSTPAVAYGRVYIGNTDSKIYAYMAPRRATCSGRARPAGTSTPRRPSTTSASTRAPTTAASMHSRRRRARRSGRSTRTARSPARRRSSTASSTSRPSTSAPTASTRRPKPLLWTFPDGKYSPIVADTKRVYLVGFGRMYGLVPMKKHA